MSSTSASAVCAATSTIARPAAPSRAAAAAVAQAGHRRAPRREAPARARTPSAATSASDGGEQQRQAVDARVAQARHVGRREPQEQRQRQPREADGADGRARGEQQHFGQLRAQQLPAARADRLPDRHLAAPALGCAR